jgi:hypothetical protein
MELKIVEFKTAKKLKEVGFAVCTRNTYGYTTRKLRIKEESRNWNNTDRLYEELKYSAPTQELVKMWLREKHGIDVTLALVGVGYGFYIHNNRCTTNKGENYGHNHSYEQALEQGILEAIKLIKTD